MIKLAKIWLSIWGKNDSQNKRLAARIVLQFFRKVPTMSAFFVGFEVYPYHPRTPFSRKTLVGGRELVSHHLFMKHDIAEASVQLCKTLR